MRLPLMMAAGVMGGSAKIYGVSWTKVESPTLTRTDAALGMVANAGVDAGAVVNDFDTAEIYKDITEVTDALGNVFVRIPKFYIEKTDSENFKSWRISKKRFGTAYLPWCFVGSGGEILPYVDVGKYNANLNGTKLESKAGTYPLINKHIVDMRTYATNNGAGYYQMDIHVVDVLQTLFYVEFATLNSQAIMRGFDTGAYSASHVATVAENNVNRIIIANAYAALFVVGQTISIGTALGGNQIFYGRTITAIDVYDASNKAISFDGAPVNIAVGNIVYSTGWKSGFSSSIAAKSGSIGSNSNGLYPCMYRGIENLWGSVFEFVDGVNINEYQAWVCKHFSNYASNLFAAPYLQLGYVNHNADGYSISMGWDANNPYAAFPTGVAGGASTKYYCDYYYRSTGQRVALLGGSWVDGLVAGLSCWAFGDSSTVASIILGARLLKTAL